MGLITTLVTLALAVQAAAAPHVYVDAASIGGRCSDSRGASTASSAAKPLCSISRALRIAPAGSRIIVRGGGYPRLSLDGFSRSDYVTVQAFAGEAVSLDGVSIEDSDHIRIQGFKVTSDFRVTGTDHAVQIVGNEIGNQRSGLFIYGEDEGSSDITIAGNTIHDIDYPESDSTDSAAGYGIQMIGSVSHVRIEHNTIRSVVEDYIQGGGSYITVAHNSFLGPSLRYRHSSEVHADLWQIFGSSSHIVFADNVARDTGTQNGLLFQFNGEDRPHQDVRIVNNVFDHASDGTEMQIYNTDGLLIANNTAIGSKDGTLLRRDDRVAPGSGYRIVNNIFQSRRGTSISVERNWGVEDYNVIVHRGFLPRRAFGRHDIVGRWPHFVDRKAGDYHLAPHSIAIGRGTPDGAPPRDIDGVLREGRPDIGAYEFQPSHTAPRRAIAHLRLAPRRFRVARGRHARARGSSLRFTLSRRARVSFTFRRRAHGGHWRAVRGRRVVRHGSKGANRVRFLGRVGGHWLRPGSYRARARVAVGRRTLGSARATFVVRR